MKKIGVKSLPLHSFELVFACVGHYAYDFVRLASSGVLIGDMLADRVGIRKEELCELFIDNADARATGGIRCVDLPSADQGNSQSLEIVGPHQRPARSHIFGFLPSRAVD